MAETKFQNIFKILKKNIIHNVYKDHMLPSEHQLIEEFHCSRATIRRAINELIKNGYAQSIKGKGVILLEPLKNQPNILLNLHNFSRISAISAEEEHQYQTKLLTFQKILINRELSEKTNLPENQYAYYIERLRIIDNNPWVLDINYFLCDAVTDLTPEIAEQSIYNHIENTLKMKIIAARRIITIQKAMKQDKEHLNIDAYDCVGVILSDVYLENGKLFEHTETHYSPSHFAFVEFVQR